MLELLYKRRESRKMSVIDSKVTQLVFNPVVQDGKPVRISEVVTTCVHDNFKQFKARDFDVQSIIAVGAVHLLKPVSLRNADVQGFADNVDTIASGLDKQLNSVENVQV